MTFSRSDVGKKVIAGVEVELSDAEKDAIVLRWNKNEEDRKNLPEPEVINLTDIITELERASETKARFDAIRASRREA
tara:strand:- start:169 stop:402 length:234 start_codon:yes stop_codon:yes gene_type:complete